jgi:hypothetical protein
MDAQSTPQTTQNRKGGNPNWKPGYSGNPSGVTRKMRRTAEFLALFQTTHHRAPNAVELANLKGAAAAARLDRQGLDAEDIVRLANVQSRLLDRLGLSGAPSRGDGKVFPDHGLEGGSP